MLEPSAHLVHAASTLPLVSSSSFVAAWCRFEALCVVDENFFPRVLLAVRLVSVLASAMRLSEGRGSERTCGSRIDGRGSGVGSLLTLAFPAGRRTCFVCKGEVELRMLIEALLTARIHAMAFFLKGEEDH